MNGFIDPEEPLRTRVDVLESLIDEALKHVPLTAYAPEVQRAIEATRRGDWTLARQIFRDAERVEALEQAKALASGDHDPLTPEEREEIYGVDRDLL